MEGFDLMKLLEESQDYLLEIALSLLLAIVTLLVGLRVIK
jgi:hypothetical protein